MKSIFRHLQTSTESTEGESGILDGLRESYTQAFAYDHFQWPSFERFGGVHPDIVDFRSPSERAAELRGLDGHHAAPSHGSDGSSSAGGDPWSHGSDPAPYTTTNSAIPVYTVGDMMPLPSDIAVTPESSLSDPLISLDDFRADPRFAGIDGSGYTIAVLDTGIDLNDPFFGPDNNGDGISDRIVYQHDFADNDSNAGDPFGHGSNVASIAASSDSTYTGMAPGANIAALKVFSDSGAGYFSYIERALQWVIDNADAYNIVSVNMSLGDTNNFNTPISLYGIGDEMATLASMGVIVVSASGNDFYEFNSVQGVSYPSADPNSLSVGAVYVGNTGGWSYQGGAIAYTTTNDQITPFSQRDDQLSDIFAPGAPITGAGAGPALTTYHGTSQATPHIAGIVALAQQLAVETLGRKLTFDEFKTLLATTGDTIIDGDNENDNVVNTGLSFPRVNVEKLGEAILAMAPGSTFAISTLNAVHAEGDTGTTAFTFTVTRGGDTAAAGSVDYAVSGDVDAADFAGGLPAGTLSFAAGETSKILTLDVAGDTTVEPDETFVVTLSNPSAGGTITTASAGGAIINDDVAPAFLAIFADQTQLNEGDAGATDFTFTVNRSNNVDLAGSVDYSVSGITNFAADGNDFVGGTLPSGTISFASGQTSQTITIQVQGDTDYEIGESFVVALSNPSDGMQVAAAASSAVSVILNDDPLVISNFFAIVADDATKAEGDSGTTAFTFIVTRSGDLTTSCTVDYLAGSGADPAADAFDFLNNTLDRGTLTFAIGETSKSLTFLVQGDTDFEPDENFAVYLRDPSVGAEVTTEVALGTILNDDAPPPPSLSIAALDAVKAEGDAGTTDFTFTVTRSGDTSAAGSVDYAVSGEADGSDFAGGLPGGTVNFLAGEASKTLTLAVAGDTTVEADESFTVTLSNPSGGATISTASADGTILNDDAPPPPPSFAIAALDAVKDEGDAGTTDFTFTVTRSGDTSAAGSVDYAVSGDTDGADFASGLPGGTVNFLAGETSKTLTLNVAGDTGVEPDENFTVTLSNASGGATITTASAAGTILNDDAPPSGGSVLLEAHFDATGDTGGFTYFDSLFGGSSFQPYASGAWANQALNVDLGGINNFGARNITGGWQADFTVSQPDDVQLTFSYDLNIGNAYESSEFSQVLVSIDGGTPIVVDQLRGDGNGGPIQTTGLQTVTLDLGTLAAGSHTLEIGAYNNQKTRFDESTRLTFDDVRLTAGSGETPPPPPPDPGDFSIAALNAVRAEGDAGTTAFTFTVTRSGDAAGTATVDYAVTGDADAADFAGGLPGGTVSFLAGEVSKTLTLNVAGDTTFEADEGFTVTLSNATGGAGITTASAGGTILNDDPAPPATFLSIAALDAVKAEGDAGTTAFTFTVSRSGDTSAAGSVDYAVTGDTDGADFAGGLPSGTVSFLAGEASKTLTLNVAGDTTFEADEDFTVTLSNASAGSAITTASAGGTILNDDVAPPSTFLSIAALDAVKAEGDAGTTDFTFTVSRSGDTSVAGSVDYAVSGDADGSDFAGGLPSGTVSFLAGEASKTLTLNVAGDTTFEADEDFTVTLSNASAGSAITTASAGGTILNDDVAPPSTFLSIAALDAVKAEGDAGTTDFTFTVSRSGDTSVAGSVDYAVSGDTDGADFAGGLPSGTVSFLAGEATKTLTLNVAGDTTFEADEAFTVTLSNASTDSSITTPSADGTILNDDVAPPATFLSIAALDAVKAEGDAGTTDFTFTVTRSGDTSAAGSVDYAVTGDADASDFAGGLPGGTVSFLAGEASKTLTLNVAGDTTFEADEAFTVTLSNASAGSSITTANAGGTILNDDVAPPATFLSIAALDAVKAEGDAGTTDFTFTVTRSGDTSAAGSVDYAVTGDADASDFAGGLPNGTVNFLAGEASKTLTLNVAGDTTFEADEDFTVTLSNASAGSDIIAASAGGTILNDDAAPPSTFLSIAALDALKAEGDAGTTDFTFTVSRSGDTSAAGSVDYAVSGDADGSDFVGGLPGGTVSFLAGEVSKTLTLLVAGDTTFEADEAFTVTLSNASAGSDITAASAGGTILNDDAAPPSTFLSIAALNAVKAEGDAGTTDFTFTVSRSGDTSAAGSVDYSVSGDADGSDFAGGLPNGTLDFLAGETSKTLTLLVAGDNDVEADEAFTVALSNASAGSAIDIASAAGTILNDDHSGGGSVVLISADFNTTGDTGGFVYQDGTFSPTAFQPYANGYWSGGELAMDLGGINMRTATDISGAWETTFTLDQGMDVNLSFNYVMQFADGYDADEFSRLLVSVDGGSPILVQEMVDGGPLSTSDSVSLDLGTLGAGDHTLAIGGYNNKKSFYNEETHVSIDDVLVTGTPAAGAASALTAGTPPGGSPGTDLSILGGSETDLLANTGV